MWPVVTVHDHLIREGHDPTFACIGQEISSGQSTTFRSARRHTCMITALVRHSLARGNPVIVRNRPQFGTERCTEAPRNAPGMHANLHRLCTLGAFQRRHGTRQDRPPAIAGQFIYSNCGTRGCGPRVCGTRVCGTRVPRLWSPRLGRAAWRPAILVARPNRRRYDRGPRIESLNCPVSDRTASFPRTREASRCQKPTSIRCKRMHDCPRNAPQLTSNVRSLCIHWCTNCTPQHPAKQPPCP